MSGYCTCSHARDDHDLSQGKDHPGGCIALVTSRDRDDPHLLDETACSCPGYREREEETMTTTPMRCSEQIGAIAGALVKLQGALRNPAKGRTVTVEHKSGGKHSYAYATLPDILDIIRPLALENSIVMLQNVTTEPDRIGVTTTLLHESGEWMQGDTLWLRSGPDPQSVGSAVTYARRYSITALLCLAADEDDDANSVKPPAKRAKSEAPVPQEQETSEDGISVGQNRMIHKMARDLGWDEARLHSEAGVESLKEMSFRAAGDLINKMSELKKAAKKAVAGQSVGGAEGEAASSTEATVDADTGEVIVASTDEVTEAIDEEMWKRLVFLYHSPENVWSAFNREFGAPTAEFITVTAAAHLLEQARGGKD